MGFFTSTYLHIGLDVFLLARNLCSRIFKGNIHPFGTRIRNFADRFLNDATDQKVIKNSFISSLSFAV